MIGLIVALLIFLIGFCLFGRLNKNPYITNHKAKWKNESEYKEYLQWLNKNPDIPFPEYKIDHEKKVIEQLNRTINK